MLDMGSFACFVTCPICPRTNRKTVLIEFDDLVGRQLDDGAPGVICPRADC